MKLSCKFGFDLAGSETSYCDGERWISELGECRPDIGHKKVCDFETDLCGWTQNQRENISWRRRNGWNAIGKLKFGPKHDHTVGVGYNLKLPWSQYYHEKGPSQFEIVDGKTFGRLLYGCRGHKSNARAKITILVTNSSPIGLNECMLSFLLSYVWCLCGAAPCHN